ncbi:hypothetical protein JOQ06_011462 [Pogonophryne albipinna]|uniref:Uncharacterized protein n=1 Tax=Pogonophryne albipinna TaxID=1090488 RepID=A0AAD6BEV4_9TELE|nr:hypothetical protein JOQ06_011462 [Pogonophryne albipinna]
MQYQKLQQQMEEEIGALEEKIKRKTQAAGGDTAPASVTAKEVFSAAVQGVSVQGDTPSVWVATVPIETLDLVRDASAHPRSKSLTPETVRREILS